MTEQMVKLEMEDYFEPTDDYKYLAICRRCTRTDGMTKTNEVCKYCKNNWSNQVTITTTSSKEYERRTDK